MFTPSSTATNLDQRLTGLLFCALSVVGASAIGSAAFGDRVDPQIVARSPATQLVVAKAAPVVAPTAAIAPATSSTRPVTVATAR